MSTILTISHTDYTKSVGGTEKVILEQAQLFAEAGFDVVHVCPISRDFKIKGRTAYSFRTGYKLIKNNKVVGEDLPFYRVLAFIKKEDIHRIIIHMMTGLSFRDIGEILNTYSSVEKFFYVHDYKSVCTGQVLLKNKNRYCGDNGRLFKKCANCRFYWEGIADAIRYRNLISQNLSLKFIFPSKVAKDIWHKTYPQVSQNRLLVIPHQVLLGNPSAPIHNNEKLRIAYVGYKSFNKGWSAFRQLVIADKQEKYDFYVLGKSDEQFPNVKHTSVSFLDDGPDAMIKALKNNKIDVALLWSTWPETYSYTLFESYVAGAYILTNTNSGNIAAVVCESKCGRVFSTTEMLLDYAYNGDLENDVRNDKSLRPTVLEINKDAMLQLI